MLLKGVEVPERGWVGHGCVIDDVLFIVGEAIAPELQIRKILPFKSLGEGTENGKVLFPGGEDFPHREREFLFMIQKGATPFCIDNLSVLKKAKTLCGVCGK
jgi:hypothetical protein